MSRRPSWLNLRAVSDGPRTIRLRGAHLADAFRERGANEAARLQLSVREALRVGESVLLEISFGPMVDEVVLPATVLEIADAAPGPAQATVSVPLSEQGRADYVQEVVAGTRDAAARRHRRIPVDLEVRWTWNRSQYASRARDLSYGGAFIESRVLPSVGARLDVELKLPDDADLLTLDGAVAWLRSRPGASGFGVCFKVPDRAAAARLHEAVRECEIAFLT